MSTTLPKTSPCQLLCRRVRVQLGLLLGVFMLSAQLQAQSNYATPYFFSTFAGDPTSGAGSTDGTGTAARFLSPSGIAVDGAGNYYIADTSNHTIRKITPTGAVTTLAGSAGNSGTADGVGSAARFSYPYGLAMDLSGNVFVSDTGNHTIRRITPAGAVTTFAGLAGVWGSANGNGSAAQFNSPQGLAFDASGNLYVADGFNRAIRKITPSGDVTTFAGVIGTSGQSDGDVSAATFNVPTGVAFDGSGNLYVADRGNNTIRKVSSGNVSTLAGSAGQTGSTDGNGSAARFYLPQDLTVDAAGNVYVADTNNALIRKITPTGDVSTLAGGAGIYAAVDGTGASARFNLPMGVKVDGAGDLCVADSQNNVIRKVTAAAVVTTFAGSAGPAGIADGQGTAARFNLARGITVGADGTVYVADTSNHVIRKITASGAVTTLAGSPGNQGYADGTGSAARFANPYAVAVDASDNVYVADVSNEVIRKITPGGVVTTLAGQPGVVGSADGVGSAAQFYGPSGIAVDGTGNIYVADTGRQTIRKITPDRNVTTFAGIRNVPGSADGVGTAAKFAYPQGLAVDGAGNVYVADHNNHTIRKITPGGSVTTLAGLAGNAGSADGLGGAARFFWPASVSVDQAGNVFVVESQNHQVRKITPAGMVTTVAGRVNYSGYADGVGSAVRFSFPEGVAVDGQGILYVFDTSNYAVRKGVRVVARDFGADGKTDILWENTSTGERYAWLMNGTAYGSGLSLGAIPTDWRVAATADFNVDGKTDILWENTSTGERYLWLMNGTTYVAGQSFGIIPTNWHIASAADFNGDGKPDILWENTTTGERYLWLMNDTAYGSGLSFGVIPTAWRIVGAGDFDGDSKTDILWENSVTGERYLWLMNGPAYGSGLSIGVVPTVWHIAATGDFDSDGKCDILWENTSTGERYLWLMNGSAYGSGLSFGVVSTDWRIAN